MSDDLSKTSGDCYSLDAHRDKWRLVTWCYGIRKRWVCPICHPEDFTHDTFKGY